MGGPSSDPVRVLYIAGEMRSGTTILGEVLGAMRGWYHIGEGRQLWRYGLIQDRLCGCGQSISTCSFWSEVLEAALGEVPSNQFARTMAQTGAVASDALRLLLPGGSRRLHRAKADHLDILARLYRALADKTGATVLVDSSFHPAYGRYLALAGLDVHVIHIVRDPRGFASSLKKHKVHPGIDQPMRRMPPHLAALHWDAMNTMTTLLWPRQSPRVLRLNYHDFCRNPRAVVGQASELLGTGNDESDDVFVDDRTFVMKKSHMALANPIRFQEGEVRIHYDRTWVERLDAKDRLIVTALTWPLMMWYGIPIRTANGGEARS